MYNYGNTGGKKIHFKFINYFNVKPLFNKLKTFLFMIFSQLKS